MVIYKITNNKNDKVYIGQTTQSIRDRMRNYKEESVYGNNGNFRPIANAIRQIGFENFKFDVIDTAETKTELDKKERKYIEQYKSTDPRYGYNVENGGNSVGKHSELTKKKISEAQKGSKNHMYGKVGEENVTSKEVIDLTNLKTYGSAMIAAKELGLEFSHVCSTARGERGSTGGHVFRYVKNGFIMWPEKQAAIKSFEARFGVLQIFDQQLGNTVPSSCEIVKQEKV